MGIPERRERARGELRARILAVAEELFVREGYENVSMRRIAARIEYSPTTIYHHFKDKAELFACLLEGYHGQLLDVWRRSTAGAATRWPRCATGCAPTPRSACPTPPGTSWPS